MDNFCFGSRVVLSKRTLFVYVVFGILAIIDNEEEEV